MNDIADQMPVNVIAIPLPVALATDQVMVLGVSNQAQAVAQGIEYANVLFATLNGIVYVFPAAIGRSRFPNFLPRTTKSSGHRSVLDLRSALNSFCFTHSFPIRGEQIGKI